jgi:hypothetical protein
MVYTEYSSNGTEGMGGLFTYAKSIVPFYDSLLFGTLLLIITFSIYFIQESKRGKGDFQVAFAVGCTATLVLATIISLIGGFTNGTTLGVLVGLTIVSYIWLFYSEP